MIIARFTADSIARYNGDGVTDPGFDILDHGQWHATLWDDSIDPVAVLRSWIECPAVFTLEELGAADVVAPYVQAWVIR